MKRALPPLAALALGGLVAAAAPAGVTADRFTVAGITAGTPLAEATASLRQTFEMEGLDNIQEASAAAQRADGGAVLRLTLAQGASEKAVGDRAYRADSFRLRLAGPPDHPVVTELTRDYLAATPLDRAAVIAHLTALYGPPTTANVPDAAVAPSSGSLTWLMTPGGRRGGGGPQYSADLQCLAGLLDFDDAFDNAGDTDAPVLAVVDKARRAGCGVVLQVSLSYDAVHTVLLDTGAAAAALRGGTLVAARPAVKPAPDPLMRY